MKTELITYLVIAWSYPPHLSMTVHEAPVSDCSAAIERLAPKLERNPNIVFTLRCETRRLTVAEQPTGSKVKK